MTHNREWFITYELRDLGTVLVLIGNDAPCKIVGIGTVRVKMHNGIIRTLEGIRHIPDLGRNLISVFTFDSEGYSYSGGGGVLRITKGSLVVIKGRLRHAKLYVLEGSTIIGDAAITSSELDKTTLWHLRLGHMSENGLTELSKRGLIDGRIGKLEFCEHCVFGKQKRVSFGKGIHSTKGTLDYVHSDLWRPSHVPTKGGTSYMLTVIDDFSRKVWVFFLRHKREVFATFKQWKTMIEKQTGKQVKRLRTDNGLEFCSGEFNSFC